MTAGRAARGAWRWWKRRTLIEQVFLAWIGVSAAVAGLHWIASLPVWKGM